MPNDHDVLSPAGRDAIIAAAFEELVARGTDSFTIARVAERAGVDPAVIEDHWHDRRVLLMEAILSASETLVPIPDTGSLRGDLTTSVEWGASIVASRLGRRQMRSMLPSDADFDPTEVKRDFWEHRFNAWSQPLRRAADRGELRDDVDPLMVAKMLGAAMFADLMFIDGPVDDDYAAMLIEILLRGIRRHPDAGE